MQTSYAFEYARPLLYGALTTVKLTVMSECVALVVGFSVGMVLAARPSFLRLACQFYVELFRGTSALVQLFFLYFILPQAGVRLDPTFVAVAGLGLNSGAYCAEFVRGAIRAVPREQLEAAQALGLSRWHAYRLVIWPQAVFRALPPLGNMSIDLLKLTSIVSFITINDLTFVAYQINQTTLDTISLFSIVLVFYFVVAQLIAFAFRQAEKRAGRGLALGEAGNMSFDIAFAWSILPVLARAALVTVFATLCGYAIAVVVGLALALARLHAPAVFRSLIAFCLEFVRSTPILVQVFFFYFVMPRFGIRLPAFETGVLALGLHYGSYLAEVFRAGFQSIKAGQWEAAIGLGLRKWQCYRLVILPQVVPPLIPAFGNYLILMFKDTPLLSAISILELMQTAKLIGSETFRYVEPLSLVAAFFLVMSLASAALIRQAERRYQRWISP